MTDRHDWSRLARRIRSVHDDPVQPRRWKPAVDVYRTRTGWLVKVELAGVAKEEVEIQAHGRLLVVRGRRCDRECREPGEFYSLEIRYSEFERVLELPCELDTARVSTDTRDGMLLVWIEPCGDEP